jgi:uncharacterized membrane protein
MRSSGESREGNGRSLRAGLSLVAAGALVLYPLLMYVSESRLGVQGMAIGVIAVCLLRLGVAHFGTPSVDARAVFGTREALLVCCGAIALALVSIWRGSSSAMLYYPVLVNGVMLIVFGGSLFSPPTVVERIARLRHKELPSQAIPYLRRVTAAWCAFFITNGAIALYTATASSFETWALYNGLIAYLLIGAMFAAEFLIRIRVMRGLRT